MLKCLGDADMHGRGKYLNNKAVQERLSLGEQPGVARGSRSDSVAVQKRQGHQREVATVCFHDRTLVPVAFCWR